VDERHFDSIVGVATSREAWHIFEKCNEWVEILKKIQL